MNDSEHSALLEELRQYKEEKENIRNIIGQIGGSAQIKFENIVTLIFVIAITVLFGLDLARHVLDIHLPLPDMFSLQIGVFFVSLKIIWMMHRQAKVDHFQFWILNSIEFRINDITKKVNEIEKKLEK